MDIAAFPENTLLLDSRAASPPCRGMPFPIPGAEANLGLALPAWTAIVAMCYRPASESNSERCGESENCGFSCDLVRGDLPDSKPALDLVQEILEWHRRIDALVHAARTDGGHPVSKLSSEEWLAQ